LATIVSAVQRDFKDYFQTSTSSALPDPQVERDDGRLKKFGSGSFSLGENSPIAGSYRANPAGADIISARPTLICNENFMARDLLLPRL